MIEFDQSHEDSTEEVNDVQEEGTEETQGQEIEIDDAADEPEDEVSKLENQIAGLNDKHLRLAAEYQNYRKRTIQDFTRKLEQGRSDVALAVLPVLDDMRRSLETTEGSEDSFVQGVRLVFDKFNNELSRFQIKKMEVLNEEFIETHHEALQFLPAPDGVEEGTILAEVQPGYMMGEKVLRHAQVIIAKTVEPAPSTDESENKSGDASDEKNEEEAK